jgi:arylsulfatase A-like enzyme
MAMSTALSRRELLLGTSALAAAQTLVSPRPNILWLMADEYRADGMRCAGNSVVSTPNLDRIAREGVRFSTTYTVSPVCSPSRASAFSGRYATVHGVTTNQVPANNGEIFLPSILKHYGYHTAISGKLHFVPKRFDFGFDQFWSFTAEGPTPELGYQAFLQKKYGSPAKFPIVPGTCPWPDDPLGHDVGVFRREPQDFETEWIADRALDYLRSRKGNPRPWFLYASFLRPHSPSVLPKKYFDMYDPDKVPIFKLPPNARQMRVAARELQKRHIVDDERMERVITAKYYGAITNVDDNIGRILLELERLGMLDNTIILFSSDHGNMLGEKARWFKGLQYDGSARIPLLWRGPKGASENGGRVEDKIIENIDLMPTVLEAAGIPIPEGVQGRSFLKLARGQDGQWKNRCFSQLHAGMIRTPQWKLIDNSLNLSGELELYDMRNDPREERNVAGEARNRDLIADLRQQLTMYRADKPAPVRIAGMPAPAYATISDEERKNLRDSAPVDQN